MGAATLLKALSQIISFIFRAQKLNIIDFLSFAN